MNTGICKINRADDCRHLPIFTQNCDKLVGYISREYAKQAATGLRIKQGFDMRIKLRASITL